MEGEARLAISDKKRNRNLQMKVEGCEYRQGGGGAMTTTCILKGPFYS